MLSATLLRPARCGFCSRKRQPAWRRLVWSTGNTDAYSQTYTNSAVPPEHATAPDAAVKDTIW